MLFLGSNFMKRSAPFINGGSLSITFFRKKMRIFNIYDIKVAQDLNIPLFNGLSIRLKKQPL